MNRITEKNLCDIEYYAFHLALFFNNWAKEDIKDFERNVFSL